jgi:hypothetical protein
VSDKLQLVVTGNKRQYIGTRPARNDEVFR